MPIPVILALSLLGCQTDRPVDAATDDSGAADGQTWTQSEAPATDDLVGPDVVATELCGYLWEGEDTEHDHADHDTGFHEDEDEHTTEDDGEHEDTGDAYVLDAPELPLAWCQRVTPEPDDDGSEVGDTGVVLGGDGDPGEFEDDGALDSCETPVDLPEDAPPPPCSFSNLVGSFRLLGPPDDPLLTYCDDDEDGGLRSVVLVEEGRIRNRILDEQACLPDPDSAAVVEETGGLRLYYVEPGGADVSTEPVLARLELDREGRPLAAREVVDVGAVPNSVQALAVGDGTLLVIEGSDGSLAAVRPAAERRVALLAEGVTRTAAVAVGDSVAVAACQTDGALHAFWLEASGAVRSSRLLDAAGCDGTSRPALATDGADVLLALHQTTSDGGALGRLLPLSRDLDAFDPQAAVFLDGDAALPAVAWDASGERYVSLDATGAVTTWTSELTMVDRWAHPAVSEHRGVLDDFRLVLDGDTWTFAVLGHDDEPTFPGHSNTYFYVELSQVPAP